MAGRATLRCDRGRDFYGPGDEKLQQPELDEPLVNPRRKKEGRRRLSFTGGDEFTTAAAGTRGGDDGELMLEREEWLRVQRGVQELEREEWLRVQRGVQELERVLK
jgi:hypothetical protein